jgi:predicted RecB family nuclease
MPAKNQKPFKLGEFMGVNPDQIAKLESLGVKTTGQMLIAGKTPQARADLARQANLPQEVVLELVKLSDLSRLPGVKGIRARLYVDAGVDTVEMLAAYETEALLALTTEFVQKAKFKGIAPLPKEVSSTITNAKKLPKLVEW